MVLSLLSSMEGCRHLKSEAKDPGPAKTHVAAHAIVCLLLRQIDELSTCASRKLCIAFVQHRLYKVNFACHLAPQISM